MIWKNAELHGVSELTPNNDGGYVMHRLPVCVEEHLSSEQGKSRNVASTGVEIRFRVRSGSAKITLALSNVYESVTCCEAQVWYGGLCAAWDRCRKEIYREKTVLEFLPVNSPEYAESIHKEHNIPYAYDLVRLILPSYGFIIYDIEGDIEPPRPEDLPGRKLLTYGSSITHGSTAMVTPYTWAFRLAENLDADLLNCGFAGSARMEKEVADHLATLDFDVATIEMGINVLGSFSNEEFYSKCKYFVEKVATSHPESEIFAIDIFFCSSDAGGNNPQVRDFRDIIKRITEELNLPNVHHVRGTEILTSSRGLSGDLVHPNPRGVDEIAANMTARIKAVLDNK